MSRLRFWAACAAFGFLGAPLEAKQDLLNQFLAGPASNVTEIIFAARPTGKDPHWYANFSYYAHDPQRKAYEKGGKLYRLNLSTGKLTTLLEDPEGGVRDPQVHYDGGKILFAYRKGGSEQYHLYEINVDGTGLKQLTDGPFDDIEPTYVADGGIVFVSTRCKRWVNCWLTQVANLYRCEADGSHIRELSSNNEHDNTPWPLPDGRILYTRWEYVDRSQVHYHHLWTMNPDGTDQAVWFGNYFPGTTMIDAKPIPGSAKVVASFSPGHGLKEHLGVITVVDPTAGPDAPDFAKKVPGENFRDPWAFSESCFIAAKGAKLFAISANGGNECFFQLPTADINARLECHEPRPIASRPREAGIPSKVREQEATGRMVLADVYDGRNMAGVKRGEVKKLLVLETLPMPIHYTGGMDPISHGGTFTLERIVGTVPVEPDGSAYFEVPAVRSVFFVALDDQDLSVKRMQSFAAVQPGEVLGCIGCHEPRTQAPRLENLALAALNRPPSQIEPLSDFPDVIDFPRDIQPILDRHCVQCHDYDSRNTNMVFLTGDRGPTLSHSYFSLTAWAQVADGRNKPKSNYPPRALGSSASPMMQRIEPQHYGVAVSEHEKALVRLWIESGGAFPGTYASLGCGSIGVSTENQLSHEDLKWPTTAPAAHAIDRRCHSCHSKDLALPRHLTDAQPEAWNDLLPSDVRRRLSRHMVFNLTRPEKSLMLLAPLSRQAGGFGLCRKPATTSPIEVFSSTGDRDYQLILAHIQEAKAHLDQIKRFDMPGFRPRPDWVREMKRYGILPADLAADAPIDVYATERKYWQSLWYVPRN